MDQFQNPSLESQSPSEVPSTGPEVAQQPVSQQEGNEEFLRVLDAQTQQQPTQEQGQEPTPQPEVTQPQVPPVSEVPQTPEVEETEETDDPMEYIRRNTPGNPDNSTPQVNPEVPQEPRVVTPEETPQPVNNPQIEEEGPQENLKEELNSVKELLSAFLEGKKIKDLTEYPEELLNPEVFTSSSGREMFKPFGIQTIRFGYEEFKKSLESAMSLDEETYILRYMSERPREDGSRPEPRLLKCTKEQVDKWKSVIQQREQQTQVSGQPYQQPPTGQQF
jgi:hypothetical protein